nr:TonB family protein [uncultured Desulfuromonas sp.]
MKLTELVEHPLSSWAVAIVATLAINLALFWLLPQLTGQTIESSADLPTSAVQVVRVAPPPPKKQVAEQTPQPQPQVHKRFNPTQTPQPTPQLLKMNLQLSPQLPSLGDIAMPDVALADVAPLPDVFDSEALDRPLTPLAQSPFIYPLRAKRLGIEGWVKVKLLISIEGTVEQVHILEAEPVDMFEATVERGIRRWRFTPGTVQGQPVRSWVVTTIRFELES